MLCYIIIAILIAIPVIIFACQALLNRKSDYYTDFWASKVASIICGICLSAFVLIVAMSYAIGKQRIAIYKANAELIMNTKDSCKSATAINKAIEYNEWLIDQHTINRYLDLAVPDETDTLKLIKF